MIINNNLQAINTHRQLFNTTGMGAKSMEKLSSGFRINRAGDDAAGLAISEKMRGQIRGLSQASRNAQDGISLIQTAEGALAETHNMLQRMRELAVQANNGTYTAQDLNELLIEIEQLNEEIDRIAEKTQFNTRNLLDGSLGVQATESGAGTILADLEAAGVTVDVTGIASGETIDFALAGNVLSVSLGGVTQDIDLTAVGGAGAVEAGTTLNFDAIGLKLTFGGVANLGAAGLDIDGEAIETTGVDIGFQIGANENTMLAISIGDMRAAELGVGGINITTPGAFDANIQLIDAAIGTVSSQRAELGAWQNRLEYTIRNLDTSAENLQASESRIRDVDMAKEMMEFTKQNILQQAATAMLAQANQAPQGVLQLLR